jgi:uroporphyrinogen decarboxylase
MRQAGRCLPAYREIRKETEFVDLVRDPEAAARVTELPLEYFPVDGLVLFKDLSTPFEAAGLQVELRAGVGPVVLEPWMGPADVDRLTPFDPRAELDYVLEAIRIVAGRHPVPVLGFVGAPFTLCSYLLRGSRASRLAGLKAFILERPDLWDRLASFWADHLAEFAIAQHEAGAGAIQVFDSWAGALSPKMYDDHVRRYTARILATLAAAGVPTINFAIGNPALLPSVATAGGDAIGIDWRLPLDEAWEVVGPDRAIQGNLDPSAVLAGEEAALSATDDVLERAAGRPGHIFNVGHGLLPESDPSVLRAIVDRVHAYPVASSATSASANSSA